jgi:hypothetical protein
MLTWNKGVIQMLKMIIVAFLLVLVASVPVMADDFAFTIDYTVNFVDNNPDLSKDQAIDYKWNDDDSYRQWALIGLQTIDWYLTSRNIQNGHIELNPLLGRTPTQENLNKYFATLILGNYLINRFLLPKEWRKAWQYMNIGAESWCVYRSY